MPPLAIGALAAVLRLWAIDLAPFGYDEVDVLGRARAVVGGELTQVGPLTSWGIPDPPMSVYLTVPPSLLPRPALAAAAWMASLNVVAVLLTYGLARRFFGPWVALVAGLLYAANPWAVYFSRRSWAEIVPLFTTIALWAALEVICRRRARWAVLFFLAVALQVQTRVLGAIYAPATVLTMLPFARRWGVRWPIVGIALGVVVSLPYLLYVVGHWSELSARLAEGNRGLTLEVKNGAVDLLLWTAAGYGLLPVESRAAPWLNPLGQAGALMLWVVRVLIVGGLGLSARAFARRCSGWEAPMLAAAWLVLPILALLAQSSSVYVHYLVALFPAVFLVMALPIAALLQSRRRVLALLGGAVLVALCSVQVSTTGTLYRILGVYATDDLATVDAGLRQAAAGVPRESAEQLGTGERYGVEVPLRFWETLAERTHAEAGRANVNEVWVVAGATDPLIAERPAILDFVLRPRLVPHFLAPDSLVFPVGRPTLVLETPDVDAAESIERLGTRRATVPIPSANRAGREEARLTLLESRSLEAWAQLVPTREGEGFAGGVRLLGYRAERALSVGDILTVVTYWGVTAESPATPPVVSARLLDAAGRPALEAEPSAASPPTPRVERVLIQRHQIAIPARTTPGDYRLEVAPTVAGAPLRRSDGRGTSVLLATVRVSPR